MIVIYGLVGLSGVLSNPGKLYTLLYVLMAQKRLIKMLGFSVPHNTRAIWFWGTENPNIFIDIGNFVDTKITALQCHKTQIYGQDNQDFASQIKDRASYASSGLISSESFREVTFRV